VIATKRDPGRGGDAADEVVEQGRMLEVLPQADFVALTCPLTAETENLFDSKAFDAMKPSACLVNVARGPVVNQEALVEALQSRTIAGAALDCVHEEPLPESSPLWEVENLLITPHSAGETRRYEDNVIDLLLENLERQWRGEHELRNAVV
jgi:phosphoglycerate dehydrogenase-like enzyme